MRGKLCFFMHNVLHNEIEPQYKLEIKINSNIILISVEICLYFISM